MKDVVSKIQYLYCQKVLPLVYDESLSYYEAICKFQKKLNEVIDALDGISLEVLEEAERYTDKAIAEQRADIDRLVAELNALIERTKGEFDGKIDELGEQYRQFTNTVNANIILINQKLEEMNNKIDADIIGVNARTDLAIAQNNEYIFDVIQNNLPTELKVTNMFTGDRMSIQDMFNYLGNLHIDDGLTYDGMIARNKTYNQLVALQINYTDLILHGNTIYV